MRDRPHDPAQDTLLRPVEGQGDLWLAVETALYARIVRHDELAVPEEAEAVDDFLHTFGALVEAWEELGEAAQMAALQGLAARLAAVRGLGLKVMAGSAEQTVPTAGGGSTTLPVALLYVGRSNDPTDRFLG